MTRLSLLRRYPLLSYLVLTFAISWGGILIVLIASGFDLSVPEPAELGLLFVLKLAGPSVSGLTLIAAIDGRAGLHELWSRLICWNVGASWYALALLTAPLLLLAVLLPLSMLVSPDFAPRFQWGLLAVGLLAGGFEEIGWTGFAAPRLLARHRLWIAGMSLGFVWALWHLLVDLRYNMSAMGDGWMFQFAIVYLATLTPFRILMTWVYSNTSSLLLAVLMHASYTGALMTFFPATTFGQGMLWQAMFAIVLWGAALIVLRSAERRSPSITPIQRDEPILGRGT